MPCLTDVTREEFESLAQRFGKPTDDDRRALFDGPRVPDELVEALVAEWAL